MTVAGDDDVTRGEAAAAGADTSASVATPPGRRRARSVLLAALAGLVLLLVLAGGSAWWMLRNERGTAWLLSRLPGLEVVQPRGTLLGDFGAEAVVWRFGAGGELRLEQVAWQGLGVYRSKAQGAWALVWFDRLQAAAARLTLPEPAQDNRTPPPDRLTLPVEVVVRELQIDAVHAAALGTEALRGLSAGVHLGADQGRLHRITGLSVSRGPLRVQAEVAVGAPAPLVSDIRITLTQPAQPDWPAWQAELRLAGPLAESTLNARLATTGTPGPPQTLDVEAVLQPFAEWPLKRLRALASRLDVSALLAAGPRTALSGSVDIAAADAEKPLAARVDLVNTAAGAWDTGALPLRRLLAELSGDPRERSAAELRNFDAELGGALPAGRLRGAGQWRADGGLALKLVLDGVRPDRLDNRAPALALSGPVGLDWQRPRAGQSAAAQPAASQPAAAQQRVRLTADVSGTPLAGPARAPLRLQAEADAAWTASGMVQVQLKRLVGTQGRSNASAGGSLRRSHAAAPWAAAGQVTLADFDPRPWLPGAPDSPLRRAQGRVNAKAVFDVTLAPAPAATTASAPALQTPPASPGPPTGAALAPRRTAVPAPSLLTALRGSADLTLGASQLAGVALQGQAQLRAPAGGSRIEASAQLNAAGNRLNARWRSDGGISAPATAAADIDAPALQRLAPLLQAVGLRGAAPTGSVRAQASADVRWPDLTTTGTLRADGVSWQGIRVQRADGRWRIGTQPGAPTEFDVRVARLTLPGSTQLRQVDTLDAQLSGTAAQNRLRLNAALAAAPPAWVDAVQGTAARVASAATAGPRTRLALQAGGSLQHDGGVLVGWRGQLLALDVSRPESTQPLLRTRAPVSLAWTAARGGRGMGVQAEPGSAEVLGSALRWNRIRWQAAAGGGDQGNRPPGAAPMQLDIDASIDAVPVAPLLARLQPALGWTGDLRLSARAVARTAPALRAEFTLQRAGGDLQLQQAGGARRALGLTAMNLAARADGSAWKVSGRVAAASVGNAAIEFDTRAAPGALWPDASSPLQGTAQLAIADLAIYGPWLPVGWRIGGELDLNARLSGRIGAPQYLGTVRGHRLGLAHFVEGIAIRDGELRATLDGERGRIERFTARGGEGLLRATGEARFGAAPTAQLTLVAERFRALGRVDRQVDLSGTGKVRLEATRIALSGRFAVDEGLVDLGRGEVPELSKDVRVVDGPTPGRPPPKPAAAGRTRPQRAVEMDVRVDLGSKLRVRGKGVNTLLAGDLRLSAPGGELEIDGSVRTVQGTYEAYGEKLAIERGLITFVGPLANPRLDIQAIRSDLREVEVGVAITGTAQNPRVRLISTPEMSELDKLSWLTLGRSSAGLASDQTAILQRAALALLAGQRGSAGGEGIAKRLGLDQISVASGASGGLSDAVVSLGKQVSERFYVGYTQSLDATGGGFELIYKIARRFTLRVQTGEATAIDLIWTWLWG